MTNHQHLRERAEVVTTAWNKWGTAYGRRGYSDLNVAERSFGYVDWAHAVLELLAELEAAQKDAERWRAVVAAWNRRADTNEINRLQGVLADTVKAVEANRAATDAFAQNGAAQYYFAFDESERTVLRQIEIARAALGHSHD